MNRKSIQMLNLKKPRWLTGAIAGTGVFLLAMGILIASRQPQPENGAAEAMATVEAAAVTPEPAAAPKKPARTRKAAKPAQKTAAKPVVAEKAAASETPAVRLASSEPEAEAESSSAATYTTITGCLDFDDDQYLLKDTDGENAPKQRSWKSGFLKKGSANVGVVDPSNRLRLQNHVGQRVSITGSLLDRELQARSVQRVSSTCDR